LLQVRPEAAFRPVGAKKKATRENGGDEELLRQLLGGRGGSNDRRNIGPDSVGITFGELVGRCGVPRGACLGRLSEQRPGCLREYPFLRLQWNRRLTIPVRRLHQVRSARALCRTTTSLSPGMIYRTETGRG